METRDYQPARSAHAAPPFAAASAAVLNIASLRNQCDGRRDVMADVLDAAQHTILSVFAALPVALRGKDLETLRCLAHRLKGTAATIGALNLSNTAAALESAATTAHWENVVAGIGALVHAREAVCGAIAERLADLRVPAAPPDCPPPTLH